MKISRSSPTETGCSFCVDSMMFQTAKKNDEQRICTFGPISRAPETHLEEVPDPPSWGAGADIAFLVTTLETLLAEDGVNAAMYLPSRTSSAIPRRAIIRSKRNDPRIECEVIVEGNKLKKYKFTVTDVLSLRKGRGRSTIIPDEVDNEKCLHLQISTKGELNLVFDSIALRDDFFVAFCAVIRRRGGNLPPDHG